MQKLLIIFALLVVFARCNQNNNISLADPLDTGRGFIDASLKGEYDKADKYMLQDSTNLKYLESLKDFYKKMDPKEKEGLKNANIIINPSEAVTDSTTVINYTNTYKNKPSKIKVVRINKEWKVDFKYTFSGEK